MLIMPNPVSAATATLDQIFAGLASTNATVR